MSLIGKAMLVPTTSTSAETLKNKSISLGTNTLTGTLDQFNTALTNGTFATLEGLSVQWGGPPSYNSATGVFTIPKLLTDLVNNVEPPYQLIRSTNSVTLETNGFLKIPGTITTNSADTPIYISTANTSTNSSYSWKFNPVGGKLEIPGGSYIAPRGASYMPSGISIGTESASSNSYINQEKDSINLITGNSDLSNRATVYLSSTGTMPYVGIQAGSSGDIKNWQFLNSGAFRFPDNTEQTTAWIPSTSLAGYATETFVNTAVSNLVASAPAALNTLNELATALGNDANFATTVSTSLGNRLRVDTNSQALTTQQKTNALTNLGIAPIANLNAITKISKSWVNGVHYGFGIQILGDDAQINFIKSQWITHNGARQWLEAEVLSAPIGTKFLIDGVSIITLASGITTTDEDNYTADITTDVPIFYNQIGSIVKLSPNILSYNTSSGRLDLDLSYTSSTYIPEGTNLYFTDSRARAAIDAYTGTGVLYNSTTGIIMLGAIPNASLTNSTITVAGVTIPLGGSATLNTSKITEHPNYLYYSHDRARSALTVVGGPAGYNWTSGIFQIPTNTSHVTNDSGFITTSALAGYATETFVNTAVSNLVASAPAALNTLNELATALGNDANFATTITTALGNKANTSSLSTVATSGSYSDLSNKPTIPSNTNELTNGAGFITGTSPTITTPVLNGYITRKSDNTTNQRVVDEWVQLSNAQAVNSSAPAGITTFVSTSYHTVRYLIEVTANWVNEGPRKELVELNVICQGNNTVYMNATTLVSTHDEYLATFSANVISGSSISIMVNTNPNCPGLTKFKIMATGFRQTQ